jgi:plasmid replication initiation protein
MFTSAYLSVIMLAIKNTQEEAVYTMGRHMIVRKANDLIEAKYKLTLEEQRLVLYLISLIDKDDKDFKEYEITVKEFCEFSGFPTNNFYQYFRQMSDSLLQKRIDLIEDDRIVHLCWLAQTIFYPHKGKISVQFASELKPYLLQLKGNFTYYELKNIRSLRSNYSIRLYELLKQYQKLKKRTFVVDELKTIIGVEKNYPQYGLFKKYVLLVAQKELLDKCDIYFDFAEIKEGRKVIKVEFLIYKNEKNCPADIIDSTYTEKETPPEIASRQFNPAVARTTEGFPEYQRKILDQLSFIEDDLSNESRLQIFMAAGGDVDRIRRRYSETEEKDIEDMGAYLFTVVQQPEENFKKIAKPRKQKAARGKKNAFVNFNQRENDHDELERLELEQFRQSLKEKNDGKIVKPAARTQRKAEIDDLDDFD